MSPVGMIVVDLFAQDSPEVSFVEDDHVVETLPANATNEPFDVRVLPRRARRRENPLDAKSGDAMVEVPAVYLIAVPKKVTRCRNPRKGIDDSLRRPLC